MGCCFSADADAAAAAAPAGTAGTAAAGGARRAGASASASASARRGDGAAAVTSQARGFAKEKPTKKYAKPRWRAAQEGITSQQQLERMRDEFWTTAPAYGGAPEAWQALRAACESPDLETTRLIIEAAGLIVARPDMAVVYDERGARYEFPCYALSDPEDGPLPDAVAPAAVAAAAAAADAADEDGGGDGGERQGGGAGSAVELAVEPAGVAAQS